nr:hypothetical protein [Tolypothrix sp. NIES-4075]
MLTSIQELNAIATETKNCLKLTELGNRGVRLLGISLSNLNVKERLETFLLDSDFDFNPWLQNLKSKIVLVKLLF